MFETDRRNENRKTASATTNPPLFGELWSTNKKLQALTLTNHSALSSGDYISALRGCWPLKFSHALEIHQGLLAHMTIGVGGPLKNFMDEHLNLDSKFSVFTPIILGLVGVTLRNFARRRAKRQA